MPLTGSPHFSPTEILDHSSAPMPDAVALNIQTLLLPLLEAARTAVGDPLYLTSVYRDLLDNLATVGHSGTSEHMQGLAADFATDLDFTTVTGALLDAVQSGQLVGFKQLIFYPPGILSPTARAHFHIGVATDTPPNGEVELSPAPLVYLPVRSRADVATAMAHRGGYVAFDVLLFLALVGILLLVLL
jgi:Peptidase M15